MLQFFGQLLLDLGWVNRSCINDQAVKGRVQDLLSSRTVQPGHHLNWLARSIQCIDLTTLAGITNSLDISLYPNSILFN